ncbi:TAXI family TRAP transporter solute-binding subunit [Photobacterium minamisatsumaniensis]|uniref:TAXI family TRAP transporter solute-binding subunit n=1 Tax=Photobacterium minamisatsumaniensis TaxID=2910233 RepID=UPI003D09DA87
MKVLNKVVLLSASMLVPAISQAETIEWTSGQLGGGWYSMSSGLANLIKKENPEFNLKVVPGGGTANPTKVNRGRSQLGWGLDTFTYQAHTGTVLFNGKPHKELSTIGMSFSDVYSHFIRAQDAEYKTVEEILQGKNVKIGIIQRGSSGEQAFRWIMEANDTDYNTLRKKQGFKINHGSFAELSAQFKDGQVDYIFGNLGLPGAVVIEMGQSRDLAFVDFSEQQLDKLNKNYGLLPTAIPANTYQGVNTGANTIKMATTLMVNNSVSVDTVYKITKSICDNQDKLTSIHSSMSVFDCATSMSDAPAPIHPGAAKYFKEKGYL